MELERILVVDPIDGEYTADVRISGSKIESIKKTGGDFRSEERRVGKECRLLCRSRWSPYH